MTLRKYVAKEQKVKAKSSQMCIEERPRFVNPALTEVFCQQGQDVTTLNSTSVAAT